MTVKLCAAGFVTALLMSSAPVMAQVYGGDRDLIEVHPYYDDTYGWPGLSSSVVHDAGAVLEGEVEGEPTPAGIMSRPAAVSHIHVIKRVRHRSRLARTCAQPRFPADIPLGDGRPPSP